MLRLLIFSSIVATVFCTAVVNASEVSNLGGMANELTEQFTNVAKLMVAVAYVAGIGFGISSIFKFKQHKDNPTQVPIGTPLAMMTISVLLVYLPGIYGPAGTSIFGTSTGSGSAKGDLSSMPGYTGSSGSDSSSSAT